MPVATGADTGGGGGGGGAPSPSRRGGGSPNTSGAPARAPSASTSSYSSLPSYDAAPSKSARPSGTSQALLNEIAARAASYGDSHRESLTPAAEPISLATLSQASTEQLLGMGNKDAPEQEGVSGLLSKIGSAVTNRDRSYSDPMGQTTLTSPKEVDLANKNRREQTERDLRRKAMGTGEPFKPEIDRLTQAEYDAMTDEQRAAVDFNSMLVRAVRRDRKNQDTYDKSTSKLEEKTYEEAVDKTFGDDGGSKKYAPETMAVLRQIGFEDKSADLDDFLQLRAAITAKDIKRIGAPIDVQQLASGESGMRPVVEEKMGLSWDLTHATADLEETLAKGNAMLRSMTQTANVERSDRVELLGGLPTDVNGLGFEERNYITGANGAQEPGDANTFFQDAFDKLSDQSLKSEHANILATVHDTLQQTGEWDQFVKYVDLRTSNAMEWDMKLGANGDVKYKSPEQFRKMLGLDGGQIRESQPTPLRQPQPAVPAGQGGY
jgi:hypothetical protein